ncbi:hypothetical protein [Rathayibacter sp. AY1A3]|uniref:hypothetical protein n=1 Tax=Rathayibacter sp. AY1A3 TaxID=2080521 RepID=UPI000CE7695B|nr:hypothetical protein [Rathayibacter sp. AY1A3]PPF34377.1 hypothetical protein C5C10_09225 [Rathayibacter sp. AY1A3]
MLSGIDVPALIVVSQILILMVLVLFIGLTAPEREEKSVAPPLGEELSEGWDRLRGALDRLQGRVRRISARIRRQRR